MKNIYLYIMIMIILFVSTCFAMDFGLRLKLCPIRHADTPSSTSSSITIGGVPVTIGGAAVKIQE